MRAEKKTQILTLDMKYYINNREMDKKIDMKRQKDKKEEIPKI